MRFSVPNWRILVATVSKCLKIDSQCVICARLTDQSIDLCDDCESLLQRCRHRDHLGRTTQLCLSCGAQLSGEVSLPCMHCNDISQGPDRIFSRIVSPYRYAFPLDRLIQAQKYRNQRALARVFGGLLARAVVESMAPEESLPMVLVPVPLHMNRLRRRGYNQSADIAHWCARELGVQSYRRGALREQDTDSLAGLSRAERQHQILGAFRASDALAGKSVAIVDDVLTTGSTARELARELYDAGALSVQLWVLARTSSER